MKESYCGICDGCHLGAPDFLDAVVRVKKFVEQFQTYFWLHCFPGDEGFSFPELNKGLDWFLNHQKCPGCKGGRGVEHCPIRRCAQERQLEHCYDCPDLAACGQLEFTLPEFPGHKNQLRRRSLRIKARELLSPIIPG